MVEEIFKLILKTSLYASVVGIVILIVKMALKDKINPRWHYLIWIILILKLLIPFGPQSALSLFNTIPVMPEETSFTKMYEEYQQSYPITQQIGDNTQDFTSRSVRNSSLQFAAEAEKVLPYIWLSGMVSMLAWLIITNYSLNRHIKKTSQPLPQSIHKVFEDCKMKMGVKKYLQIVIQSTITTPSIFDVFNPKILISPDILNLSEKDISYILLHELAHYKRRDLVTNYILLLFQSIHWFNPVLWYCFKRMRQDMEVAADEVVLNLLESREQKEYGKAIIAVIENISLPKLAPRLIGMVDGKKSIEKRIKMIKRMEFFKNRRKITFIIGVLCVMVLSSILLTSGLTRDNSKQGPVIDSVESGDSEGNQVNNPSLKLIVSPEKYTLLSSISPGIKISAYYEGEIDKVEYVTNIGTFLSWESPDGIVNRHGQKVVLPKDKAIYWSPMANRINSSSDSDILYKGEDLVTVTVSVFGKNDIVEQKQLNIKFDSKTYLYNVMLSEDVIVPNAISNYQSHKPKSIDEAISKAIKEQRYTNDAEVITEGHIILDTEEKDGKTTVYALISYGCFGFENGIFTKVSGTGIHAAIFTFEKDEKNEYSLIDYRQSDKKLITMFFPERLWDAALNAGREEYSELFRQQKEQARIYLSGIGRDDAVISEEVDKKTIDVDAEALGKIYEERIIWGLDFFPNWIGTRELVQNGVRYIYETSQSKSEDGFDILCFRRSKEDGTIDREYKFKIVGHQPQRISQD